MGNAIFLLKSTTFNVKNQVNKMSGLRAAAPWVCGTAAQLTGYTWLPPRWVCSDNGRSYRHRTDPPHPRCRTGNLNAHKIHTHELHICQQREQHRGRLTLTLAAEIAVFLQVVVPVLTGGAGLAAGVGLTVTLAGFLSGTRNMAFIYMHSKELILYF